MDTRTGTLAKRIALIPCLAVAALALGPQAPAADPRRALTVIGATAAQERAVDWAFHRYGEAGLQNLPPMEIHLHRSHGDCIGGLGLYYAGRIDLCTKDSSQPYQRKFALHEMAHGWTQANIPNDVLRAFMQRQRVVAWNDRSIPWKERGTEQAAEIITWGLGEGEIAPLLPVVPDAATLTGLYEMLTGRTPIVASAA
jgi:hypothetical protein